MKIFFDHITGKLTHYDLVYSMILAEFEPHEYDYALDNGWIPMSFYFTKLERETWINTRTCRINLTKYKPTKKQRYTLNKKNVTVKVIDKKDLTKNDIEMLSNIYKSYIKHKNYYEVNHEDESEKLWEEVFEDDPVQWKHFIYYCDGVPVAFTEIAPFNKNLVTGQFAWNYHDPKVGLGSYATLYEIDWAIKNGFDKYYLSFAYEVTSSYKSKYAGFEFWTGREWLDDKNIYKKLCEEDTNIKNLENLNDYQEKYFKIVKCK